MVSPLYKGTFNETDISSFRPVSILKTFSKIYERLTKKLVDNGMDKYLSPFISVEILDMTINDNQLKSEINSMLRLKRFLGNEERKFLINSSVVSNFSYCPLVWMLANAKSLHKIETIPKRALRFMLNGYESSYEDLLKNSGNPSMNLRRTRSLCIEIYKTINNLNPEFMKNLFKV